MTSVEVLAIMVGVANVARSILESLTDLFLDIVRDDKLVTRLLKKNE